MAEVLLALCTVVGVLGALLLVGSIVQGMRNRRGARVRAARVFEEKRVRPQAPDATAALRAENDHLARELVRIADELDAVLDKLDEVAQRLERCSCGVGQTIAAELEGAGHG